MKKKQKINKAVNPGEWILLGLTALFLCFLFAMRERPAPERGISVRTAADRSRNETAAPSVNAAATDPVPADPVNADSVPAVPADTPSDSAVTPTDSAVTPTDNSVTPPDSAVAPPDSAVTPTDNSVTPPDSVVTPTDTAVTPPDSVVTPTDTAVTPPDSAVAPSDDADGRVNLNTADLQSLCALPGIGDTLAGRIIAYREEHGSFARPEDVMRVSGIGQGKFDAMKALITV